MSDLTPIRNPEDITPEILDIAEDTHDGWFADEPRIDWEDFWDRLDGTYLADGTKIDLPGELDSPVFKALKKHVRQYRKETT